MDDEAEEAKRERGRKAFTFCIELKEADRGRIWHMKLEYNVSRDEEQQHDPPPAYFWLVWDREKTTRAFGCILIAACIISRNKDRKHKIEQILFFLSSIPDTPTTQGDRD